MAPELVAAASWSAAACQQIDGMLAGAETRFALTMILEEEEEDAEDANAGKQQTDGPHYFGDVSVLTVAGHRCSAAEVLGKMDQARLQTSAKEFEALIVDAKTRSAERWKDNEGRPLQRRNVMAPMLAGAAGGVPARAAAGGSASTAAGHRSSVSLTPPHVEQKVGDWMQRNTRAKTSGGRSVSGWLDGASDDEENEAPDGDEELSHMRTMRIVRKAAARAPAAAAAQEAMPKVVEQVQVQAQAESNALSETALRNRLQGMRLKATTTLKPAEQSVA